MRELYYIGLDLGQQQDYTALTVIEKVFTEAQEQVPVRHHGRVIDYREGKKRSFQEYQLQHLERFPLGTPYMDVAKRTRAIQRAMPLRDADTIVIADATGVGRPVLEMLKKAGVENLVGVVITGGTGESHDGVWHVPKRNLVATLQVLLQNGTLVWNEALPNRQVMESELQNFKAKINLATGHDSYEAWREREHDDIVLSVALATWYGERHKVSDWSEAKPFYG